MTVEEVLRLFKEGRLEMEEARRRLSSHHVEILDRIARLDPDRERRAAVPEVVLAEGKSAPWVAACLERLAQAGKVAMATRVAPKVFEQVREQLSPELHVAYHDEARVVTARSPSVALPAQVYGPVGVLAAGTSDVPAAEEARLTAELMGCRVLQGYDVGIAGVHRLLQPLQQMVEEEVKVVVVAAGMEGALPSLVKGLVSVPVVGLPTSVGYGFGGGGQAALMAMLQSCSPGLVVVNIDNGFGAGAAAALMARLSPTG